METKVNSKMMRQAFNKLNPQESVKVLREILKSVNAVWENQKEMAPGMVSIYQYLEFLDERERHNTGLLQRILREMKIPYDDFVKTKPVPLIKMEME